MNYLSEGKVVNVEVWQPGSHPLIRPAKPSDFGQPISNIENFGVTEHGDLVKPGDYLIFGKRIKPVAPSLFTLEVHPLELLKRKKSIPQGLRDRLDHLPMTSGRIELCLYRLLNTCC